MRQRPIYGLQSSQYRRDLVSDSQIGPGEWTSAVIGMPLMFKLLEGRFATLLSEKARATAFAREYLRALSPNQRVFCDVSQWFEVSGKATYEVSRQLA